MIRTGYSIYIYIYIYRERERETVHKCSISEVWPRKLRVFPIIYFDVAFQKGQWKVDSFDH